MANKIKLPMRQMIAISAATAAALTTAVNAEINTLMNNSVNLTDDTGTLTGTQTVYGSSIVVGELAIVYDGDTTSYVYACNVSWQEVTQLT